MTAAISKEHTGSIRKNSSVHVMLLVLKFYGRPVTFREIREIAQVKITAKNQRVCVDSLIERGYATETTDTGVSRFAITRDGISMVYEMADKKVRHR